MTQDEKECLTCGAVIEEKRSKSDAKSKFRTIIKYIMYLSAAMSLASLFVNVGVSFMTCISVTIVQFLALSSANEMLIDRDKE